MDPDQYEQQMMDLPDDNACEVLKNPTEDKKNTLKALFKLLLSQTII